MGIVYVECCEKEHCCCDCCEHRRDKCPNPVGRNELPACEGLRTALAGRGVVTVGPPPTPAIRFRFFNSTAVYNPNYCAAVQPGFRTPTISELQQIASSLTASLGGTPLCPMLVWATGLFGNPVLVRVYPATGTIGEVTAPHSWRCRAYPICVSTV